MNRLTLIQLLMKQGRKNYLEIGVYNGHIFFRIKSTLKVGVDPEFKFDLLRKIGKTFINPYNIFNQYFSETSDDFFNSHANHLFGDKKIEISLVDGMHEYHYALRDTENVLKYLDENGVIVLHDCNPITKESGRSFDEWKKSGMEYDWNGDVWKAIVHLRSLRPDVNAFVVDCDYGLGIVTKRKPENMLSFSGNEINSLTYEDLNNHRGEWLNLKPVNYLKEYFNINF